MVVQPAFDPEHVAATSLKRTMLGITAITNIVDANKIIWMMLRNESVSMPFVTIDYSSGGFEKNEIQKNTVDINMMMSLKTTNKAQAHAFRLAIAELHRATLDTSDFTNVTPYAKIWCITPLRDSDIAQSIPIYEIGGYYQIRFVIN